ncbi:hypothetical protein PF005_g33446 [Phytophthora fragariae]|uniref:Uncharacterized protein n=1 Tax=Phytophthora fragariae TaxID=53985 RepID=A0A6A4BJ64_9STRA|nr:hypothetical protein PF003_g3833 [Phytophthora fragariae]KAE8912758.1 hypothetical protein PF003_g3826 [Phytophthora fragariae]KAE8916448.1 hypothetical protein PF009_g33229 [Phytophthora fragariae]KAE8951798.1 hypothetical protein PF011_g32874 [Phytophthora fragariae]KAE9067370.1 hypothetical protein PF010_g27487 [Phytophthora fragariae]
MPMLVLLHSRFSVVHWCPMLALMAGITISRTRDISPAMRT